MAERFTKLFTAERNLYIEGSPVILRAGALLLDNLNTKALAQLKFQSISSKKILSLTVALQPQTSAGSALGDTVTHTYLDLSVERNAEFGSQTPIYLPDAETRAFVAHVAKVEFSDHTVWEAQEAKWAPLVFPTRTLEEVLQSPAAIEEYQRRFGMSANIMPEAVGDLWRCSCGALNHCDEESCHRCAANLQEMCSVNAKELEQEHFYLGAISLMERGDDNSLNAAIEQFSSLGDYKDSEEKKTACEEMIVQNGINRKKVKKISIIFGSIIAGIAACAAIICMGILPSVQINKATALMEAGQDDQAMLYLDRSGSLAQSFRSSQYHTIRNGIYSRAVNDAKTLIEEGKYGEAYTLMTDRRCAWGDTYELAKALNDGDYQKAVNDYGMTHIIVPEGVTHLNAKAFQTCKTLLSVSLPSTLQEIGDSAFVGCSSLKEITIPDKVTKIGDSAFNGCTSLTNVKFGTDSQLNWIGAKAFMGCSKLSTFTFPAKLKDIDSSAFAACSSLTTLSIPPNVSKIGAGAFYECDKLTNITLPFIGESATSETHNNFDYIFSFSVPDSLISVTITGITKIPDKAFEGCDSITQITFSQSITEIGYNAFYGCKKLTSFFIPDTVTTIGNDAFYNCSALTSITIPSSVNSLSKGIFAGCNSLSSISLPFIGQNADGTGATNFGYIFASSYKSDNNDVPVSLKNVIITGGNTVAAYAFSGCENITSLTLPNGISSIGDYAFSGCGNLSTILLPSALKNIGSNTFADCKKLNYTIHENGIYLGNSTNEYVLLAGIVDNTVTNFSIPSTTKIIYSLAFSSCSKLISVTVPNSVTQIGFSAFSGCSSLKSIFIPESVTSIPSGTFSGCSSLETITIPFVGGSATASKADKNTLFGYIFGTSNYTGGTAVEQYYSNYSSCTYYIPSNLKSVTVTGGNIFYGAFYGCSRITSITISGNVTSIGYSAFEDCTSLKSITIPNNVTHIGARAFIDCSSLTSITIPNSVTSIGQKAFFGCDSLTEITIPNSVTSIDEYTFYSCDNLRSVTFGKGVTSIGMDAFENCDSLTSITIPDSVTSIGSGAFSGCNSLTSVTIGGGVTSIRMYAFSSCSNLTSVTFVNTTGWEVGNNSISTTDLSNRSTAAKLLTSTYKSRDWHRS